MSGKTVFALLPMLLMLAGLPFIAFGLLSVRSDTTDMRQWLPDSREEREKYDWFVQHFGYDDFVLVSWPNCTLSDERLPAFRSRILKNDQSNLLRRVITGHELMDRLRSEPVKLSESEANERLSGTFVGDNGTTCAIIEVTEEGIEDPKAVLRLIIRTAKDECGLTRQELRLGGGVYEAVHIDEESVQSFISLVGLSGLIGVLVAYASLHSVRLTATVIICGGYCGALSVAMVHYGGFRLNALMLVLPALIYVLVISNSIHLVNYYRDVIREYGLDNAAIRAMSIGWMPCTLASVTTAIGMASLATSRITHVRSFGFLASTSLLVALVVLLGFLFGMMQCLLGRGESSTKKRSKHESRLKAVACFADAVVHHHGKFMIICILFFVAMSAGLWKTTSSVKIERMFRSNDELIQNYRWIERNIGPLAAVEIVVHFDNECEMSLLNRLKVVGEIQQSVRKVPDVGSTFSAATMLPPVPRFSLLKPIRRVAFEKRLQRAIPTLIEDHVVSETSKGQFWRITSRLPALRDVNYDAIEAQVDERTSVVLKKYPEDGNSIHIQKTGTILVMEQSRRQILKDLINSFLLAFVLICPLMMLILRGIISGIVSMVPNVVPAIVIFGGMGWAGIPIDIGTILTASVALGIAVDDTLHFLTWFRRGLNEGQSRKSAVRTAYQRCAVAMIQTTLICGFGILAFAGSSFIPTSRFAMLMAVLLLAALVGDLVFLPSMLAGPIGRIFETKPKNVRKA